MRRRDEIWAGVVTRLVGEGRTFREIALTLGCSPATAHRRFWEGRRSYDRYMREAHDTWFRQGWHLTLADGAGARRLVYYPEWDAELFNKRHGIH